MTDVMTQTFDLPEHLTDKADPALIGGDALKLAAVAESLRHRIADVSDRPDALRKAPVGTRPCCRRARPLTREITRSSPRHLVGFLVVVLRLASPGCGRRRPAMPACDGCELPLPAAFGGLRIPCSFAIAGV